MDLWVRAGSWISHGTQVCRVSTEDQYKFWGCQAGRGYTPGVDALALIYLLFIHRGLGVDSKPELQRVLEHRRRDLLIKQKKEEEEAKKLQSPFEKELLKRHQRLDQVELSFQPSLA